MYKNIIITDKLRIPQPLLSIMWRTDEEWSKASSLTAPWRAPEPEQPSSNIEQRSREPTASTSCHSPSQ